MYNKLKLNQSTTAKFTYIIELYVYFRKIMSDTTCRYLKHNNCITVMMKQFFIIANL